jgi:hypothetical protein
MHDRDEFDFKELTDGELLDIIYDIASCEETPHYQIVGEIRRALEEART